MKLSVIVPMYNVAAYVDRCLQSLQAQTLKDLEVILVDDGCTDETPQIAARYAEADPEHFRLIHKANGGLSDARNAGLPLAQGQYVAFLDSDDWIEPDCYEKMVRALEEQGGDVCLADLEYWYPEDAQRCHVMKGLSSWPAASRNRQAFLSPLFAWNKVYDRRFFFAGQLRYPVGSWYEDIPVSTLIFARSRQIVYVPDCLFHYRQRSGSIMANTSDPRLGQIFDIMALLRQEFEDAGLAEAYHDELEYLHVEHLCLYGMFRFIRSDSWKTYYRRARDVMAVCYPGWKKNPYLRNLSARNRFFLKWYNPLTAGLFNRKIR